MELHIPYDPQFPLVRRGTNFLMIAAMDCPDIKPKLRKHQVDAADSWGWDIWARRGMGSESGLLTDIEILADQTCAFQETPLG